MSLDRERLAAVGCDSFSGDVPLLNWPHCINAILADIAAQGYAIVPVEPTEAMLEAGAQQASDCTDDFTAHSSCVASHVWSEMLTAAQEDAE